ncbi:MAG: SMP-30/gluconolactonase/LRE family protein [Gemmatimonadota bacterium]
MSTRALAVSLALMALLGCTKKERLSEGTADSAAGSRMADSVVATVYGFDAPESVLDDAARDVYLVANINGNPSVKDNNGYIARLKPDGTADSLHFIQGGRNGVTLNAPKGMALSGDSLWVADIDALRIFDVVTGRALGSVDLSSQHAVFLNDVARAPDGSIYVTDTGIRITATGMEHPGPDRLFRVAPDRSVSVVLEGDALSQPNGVTWDATGNRLLIVGNRILGWKPGDSAPAELMSGPGGYDGVEMLGGGHFVVSSWDSTGVYLYDGTTLRAIATGLASPADIAVDRKRHRLLIPQLTENKVEIRVLPR